MTLDLVACPMCGQVAEVLHRYDLDSTDGPVPHVQTRCVQRHHFNGPEEN